MKTVKQIAAVIGILAFMTACGKEEDTQPPQVVNSGYPGYYGGQPGQPNFYGNTGFPCQGAVPPQIQGNYSDPCQFMIGNPNAIVRYGDRCYYARDLYGMYSQYSGGQPSNCQSFLYSPYAQFQLYSPYGQQATGSYNYSNSTNISSQWTGMSDYFGGFPGMGGYKPRDQWYIDFNLWWNNNK